MCRHVWKVRPNFATARAEASDLDALSQLPHEAVLVIGDAALHLRAANRYPFFYDLGTVWKKWTGLPFVFAVWAARRDTNRTEALALHDRLLQSRDWGLAHLDLIADEGAERTGIDRETVRAYLNDLDWQLSYRHLAGLSEFFGRLAGDGLVPDGSLTFLTAA
jgi:chorismate dehydratase